MGSLYTVEEQLQDNLRGKKVFDFGKNILYLGCLKFEIYQRHSLHDIDDYLLCCSLLIKNTVCCAD